MRRRKKDKLPDSGALLQSSAEESPEFYNRGRMVIKHAGATGSTTRPISNSDATAAAAAAAAAVGKTPSVISAKSRSPPQQRKRSILGLGSVRDLVEQVQDSLTKSKQEPAPTSGGSAAKDLGGGAGTSKPATPSAPESPLTAGPGAGGVEPHGAVVRVSPPPKKKVLDIKLLPTGTSLTLRTKKQAQFTPSPSEFKARERADVSDVMQPFCGVCTAPFSLMVRRQRCQVCAESVCAQCSTDRRHVEGQKGLQRVCDICIVEGPVVLDDNGMYAAGLSPSATPIVEPQCYAPPSASSLPPAVLPSVAAPPPSSLVADGAGGGSSVPPATRTPNPSSRRDGNGATAAATSVARALFTDSSNRDRRSPSVTSSGGGSRSRGGRGNGPGGGGGSGSNEAMNPTTSISVSSAGGGGGRGDCEAGSVGSHGMSTNQAGSGVDGGVDSTAGVALVDDDEADAEEQGGLPPAIAPTRVRKRGKKARRAAGSTEARGSGDRRQSFSELIGIGGVSGSSGSGSVTDSSVVAGSPSAGLGGGGGFDSEGAIGSGGGTCCTTRNWESTGKKWSFSAGAKRGARQAVDQGSGFVRDFVRGAGIHRLDPRQLVGPIMTCASWTRLDRIFAGASTLVVKLPWSRVHQGQYNSHGRSQNGGKHGGGGSRSRGGAGSSNHSNGSSPNSGAGHARSRWRPGRRTYIVSAIILLASYRRYQVTHPQMTLEKALEMAKSLLFQVVIFLARAIAELALDACGAILPSLCGSRYQRLGGRPVGPERVHASKALSNYAERRKSLIATTAAAAGIGDLGELGEGEGEGEGDGVEGEGLDEHEQPLNTFFVL